MSNGAVVDLNWEGEWKFTAADGDGHTVSVQAPMRDGDEVDGFKPTYLMLAALGGCTGIDVVSILQKKRQDVTGLEIRVVGSQEADWPKAWTSFNVHYIVKGRGVDPKAVDRSIHLSEEKYCSVGATLKGAATITTSFEVVEDES